VVGAPSTEPDVTALHEGDWLPQQLGAVQAPDDHDLRVPLAQVCERADIPEPHLWILDDPVANAFATGPDAGRSAVTFTTGILQRLSPDRLRAVLAHEVGHVVLEHVGERTELAARLAQGATMTSIAALWAGDLAGGLTDDTGDDALFMGLGVAVAMSAQASATRRLFAHSREQEHAADDVAAVLGGSHEALSSALVTLEQANSGVSAANDEWLGFLGFGGGHSSHPTNDTRAHHVSRWGPTEITAHWWCCACHGPNGVDEVFCVHCRVPRAGPEPTPAERCTCGAEHVLGAAWCGRCGGQAQALDLATLFRLRTPTRLGFSARRRRQEPTPLLPERAAELVLSDLPRVAQASLRRHVTRVQAVRDELDGTLLAVGPAKVQVGGTITEVTLAVTTTGLAAVLEGSVETVHFAELEAMAQPGDQPDTWWCRTDGTDLWITPDDGAIATSLRAVLHHVRNTREGRHGRVVW